MKNEDLKKIILHEQEKIIEAVKKIDAGGVQAVLIVDDAEKLIGIVSDADIRRGLLKRVDMNSPVSTIMNTNPTVATDDMTKYQVLELMRSKNRNQIPIINKQGKVVSIEFLNTLLNQNIKENVVVLMAGGMGRRLGDLTENSPKPMLKVGDRPLLETIIDNFLTHGFKKFYITVNYKAEMVKNYFGDGSKWGCTIEYVEEKTPLGTAGSLGLIPLKTNLPVIVMNGDLLTKLNVSNLLDFHTQHKSDATMCVREYDLQIPYGVVNIESEKVTTINEKPSHKFFVNAGIYVLQPEVLKFVPDNTFFDMTSLFKVMKERDKKTFAFPIREYWMDIGKKDDFDKANLDWESLFGGK